MRSGKLLAFDKWILLHVRKKLLNFAVRVINQVLPSPRAQFPQTQLLEDVYERLLQAYRVEVFCGRFDDVPYQTLDALKDKHFLNILEVSRKLLIYLGDTDRYYRQWLGLFLLVSHDAVDGYAERLTVEEACRQINGQWDYGLDETVLKRFFPGCKRTAQEMVFCNFLHNLVTVNFERGDNKE